LARFSRVKAVDRIPCPRSLNPITAASSAGKSDAFPPLIRVQFAHKAQHLVKVPVHPFGKRIDDRTTWSRHELTTYLVSPPRVDGIELVLKLQALEFDRRRLVVAKPGIFEWHCFRSQLPQKGIGGSRRGNRRSGISLAAVAILATTRFHGHH
jgi:hypothetical protein